MAAVEDFMPSLGGDDLREPARPRGSDPAPAEYTRWERKEFGALDAGTGLFSTPGEAPLMMGDDGDDVGRSGHHQAVGDMLDSGHGFLVRNAPAAPKTVWRETCEVCGDPLPTPGDDPDWLCQYYDETRPASLTCNCAWCLRYQDYLAGKFRPQGGRPRKRCGNKACDREADRLRKRRDRGAELPPDPIQVIVSEPRSEYEYALTARGKEDVCTPAPVWNRRWRRNEPNWWLSFQRKRGLWGVSEKPRN